MIAPSSEPQRDRRERLVGWLGRGESEPSERLTRRHKVSLASLEIPPKLAAALVLVARFKHTSGSLTSITCYGDARTLPFSSFELLVNWSIQQKRNLVGEHLKHTGELASACLVA